MNPNQNPLIRPINSYMLPIAPQAQQPFQPTSPGQFNPHVANSLNYLFQVASPQERQAMQKQYANTPYQQVFQGQNIHADNPYAVQAPNFGSQFTNALMNPIAAPGFAINNFVKPVVNTVGDLPSNISHLGQAIGTLGQATIQGQHGDALNASKQRALDQVQQAPIGKYFGTNLAQNNAIPLNQQLGGIAGNTAENVLNVAGLIPGTDLVTNSANLGLKESLVQGGKTGAAYGAGYGAAGQLQTGDYSPLNALKAVATGAATGAALGGGLGAGGYVAGVGIDAIRNNVTIDPTINQNGFIAGFGSRDFQTNANKGKTQVGADGQPRFEVSDKDTKLVPSGIDQLVNGKTTLGDVLKSPTFDRQYGSTIKPKEIEVVNTPLQNGLKALSDTYSGTIHVDMQKMTSAEDLRNVLLHERQHFIQAHEGFATGSLPAETPEVQATRKQINDIQGVIDNKNGQYDNAVKMAKDRGLKGSALASEMDRLGKKYDASEHQANLSKAWDAHRQALADQELAQHGYKNSYGEAEADTVENRSHMSQQEINRNPVDPSYGIEHPTLSFGNRYQAKGTKSPEDTYNFPSNLSGYEEAQLINKRLASLSSNKKAEAIKQINSIEKSTRVGSSAWVDEANAILDGTKSPETPETPQVAQRENEPTLDDPNVKAVQALLKDTGKLPSQLKAEVTNRQKTLLRTELGNMIAEIRNGKVQQGSVTQDAEGNFGARQGRFSTNPEWYKRLYNDMGITKPQIESAIANGRTNSKVYQELLKVADTRLSGKYSDPMTGLIDANKAYLGAQRILSALDNLPKEKPSTIDEQAKSLGMTPDQAKKATQEPMSTPEANARSQKATSKGLAGYDEYVAQARREGAPEIISKEQYDAIFKSPSELKADAEAPKLTRAERQQIINDQEGQGTKNHVDMSVEPGNVKGAIAKATGVAQEADDRLLQAQELGRKLDPKTRELLYRVEDGEALKSVLKDVPARERANFRKTVTSLYDGFDYALAGLRSAGSLTFRQHDYIIPHYYEATAEKMKELGIDPADQVKFGGKTGFHDKSAKYSSYIEAQKHGLQPLYKNPMDAVDQYRHGASSYIRNNGLYEALKSAAPTQVADLGVSRDNAGTKFTQAAGTLPFNASPEINDALKNFRSTHISNPAFAAAYAATRKVNSLQKAILFFGAPFHYGNITTNFLGLTDLTGHPILGAQGVKDALENSLTLEGHTKAIETARADGTLAYVREKLGMQINSDKSSYRPDTFKGNIQRGLDKVNLLGMTHRNMNNFIDAYTLALGRALKDAGVDGAQAIEAGHELDMVLGRINAAVEGHNPFISKLIGDAGLAPMFTRSQLGLARDAITKSIPGRISVKGVTLTEGSAKTGLGLQNAGDIARSAVLGKRALEAAVAITGSAIIAGQLPTLQKAMNQAGLNPNNPVPNIDLQHKNKSGHNQVMNLPTDPAGMAVGAVTDPIHFLQARSSPSISFATRVATNKDWNGDQIVDKNQPGWQTKLLEGAAAGGQPIGAQNLEGGISGKLTPAQAIAQEFGGRVKTDPNDPGVAQAKQHYQAMADGRKSLGANDQAAWDTINPQTKMADGTYTQAANFNPFKQADKVYTLLSHPAVLDAMVKANQSQPNHDPMYDLPTDQLKTFLIYQGLQGTDRGVATAKEFTTPGANGYQDWIAPLQQARAEWGKTLPKSQNPDAANPIGQAPQADGQLQSLLDAAQNISDPKQKAQFYAMHPEVNQFFNQEAAYTNAIRSQQGVQPFAQGPVASPTVQAMMNSGNFRDSQVQQFLNATTAFKASGPFGDGIGGAGGQRNTSPQALTNLAMGLQANGKPTYASSSRKASNSLAKSINKQIRRGTSQGNKQLKFAIKSSQKHAKHSSHIASKPRGFKLG